jgi:UDP-glucuronate decarboxylase
MKKRVLVTGGAGFLGSHLCEKLLEKGYKVICVDNLYSGKEANIHHLLENPNFEFLQHDITIPIFVEADEIYNLACPASPVHYQRDPVQTVKTSVYGAVNMLDLAKKLKIKILQASTSEIYGNPEINPQIEEYCGHVNPIGLRSCYDEGKRVAETLFFDYYRQYRVKIKVIRIFNTYGPKMNPNDGRVIVNFIMQALQNKPVTVYGNGDQTRSFCFVDDLIDGMIKMMETDDTITGPINLGNPEEISIKEVAELVIKMTNSKSKIKYAELPSDDPKRRKPDITKARQILNWEPKTPFTEGLLKTILYFDDFLKHKLWK